MEKSDNSLKWLVTGGAALLILLVAVGAWLIVTETPAQSLNPDLPVARIDGRDINVSDVLFNIRAAEEMLAMEYFTMFPDDMDFDYERPFRRPQCLCRRRRSLLTARARYG